MNLSFSLSLAHFNKRLICNPIVLRFFLVLGFSSKSYVKPEFLCLRFADERRLEELREHIGGRGWRVGL